MDRRYKTEFCRNQTTCRFKSRCKFAHSYDELRRTTVPFRYKSELCVSFHYFGRCTYHERCHYIHNLSELFIHKEHAKYARAFSVLYAHTGDRDDEIWQGAAWIGLPRQLMVPSDGGVA